MGGAGQEAGWGEMTSCDSLRAAFAADCKRVVDKYGLDGLDFDWEFPQGDQQDNYVKLFKDVREAPTNVSRLLWDFSAMALT